MPQDLIKKTSTNVAAERRPSFEEEIRRRAYEFYETRGREDGHDLEDWLRAEAEVRGTAVKRAFA